jgi:hypothetical protein
MNNKKTGKRMKVWDCTPTPEYMEAFARAMGGKHCLNTRLGRVEEEMKFLRDHPERSVRYGITDKQEQHRAVAAKWPHLYTEVKHND